MEYTYRLKSFEGRHLPEKKKGKKRGKITARIIICLLLAAAACGARLFFPEETAAFLRRVGISRQYEKTVQAIGKAVNGEKTLDEAWDNAFGTEKESTRVSADEDNYGMSYEESVQVEIEELVIPTDGLSYDEAAVAAFKETQSAYGSYGVPDRATYDMQPVAFNYICPVMGTVTSHFGYRTHPNDGVVRFHYGTDIGAREGTEILSFGDGRVKAVGNSSSYGKYVMVDHGENTVTMYAHCSAITVSEGDRVLKGDKIAESGSTGNATGDCVHFEVIVDGKYVNPEYYVSWS